jgi:hypothetical protein
MSTPLAAKLISARRVLLMSGERSCCGAWFLLSSYGFAVMRDGRPTPVSLKADRTAAKRHVCLSVPATTDYDDVKARKLASETTQGSSQACGPGAGDIMRSGVWQNAWAPPLGVQKGPLLEPVDVVQRLSALAATTSNQIRYPISPGAIVNTARQNSPVSIPNQRRLMQRQRCVPLPGIIMRSSQVDACDGKLRKRWGRSCVSLKHQ